MPKPRAPKACLRCRTRKVRCDVAYSGRPCRNCDLDGINCHVATRKPKRSQAESQQPAPQNHLAQQSSQSPASLDASRLGQHQQQQQFAGSPPGDLFTPNFYSPPKAHNHDDLNSGTAWGGGAGGGDAGTGAASVTSESTDAQDADDLLVTTHPSAADLPVTDPTIRFHDAEVMDLHFISMPDLTKLSPEDLTCLRLQSCLLLPTQDILEEYVRYYFLHVHPTLPIVDEAQFWSVYCERSNKIKQHDKIPLVVFQAMLSAASSFVPESVAIALGFTSPRAASSSFYKRAKVLYHIGTETSPVNLAQAALLLTFWPANQGTEPPNANIAWLSTAIHHAKAAHAHCALSTPLVPPSHTLEGRRVRGLRRLWWCCIIRDRSLSLGLRRDVLIPKSYPPLVQDDLKGELESSLVHDAQTKKHLMRIVLCLVELCTILTDLLPIISIEHVLHDDMVAHPDEITQRLAKAEASLSRWHTSTKQQLSAGQGYRFRHHSIIIHSNILYTYYHAARLGLYRHDLLGAYDSPAAKHDPPNLRKRGLQIQDATSNITDLIRESVQLGLIRYMPLNIAAFMTMPLLYHILDMDLRNPEHIQHRTTAQESHLATLKQAMEGYRSRFNGVESVSRTMQYIIQLAQQSPAIQSTKNMRLGLTNLIICHPVEYLRLTLTMDLELTGNFHQGHVNIPCSPTHLLTHLNEAMKHLPTQPSDNPSPNPPKPSPTQPMMLASQSPLAASQSPITSQSPPNAQSPGAPHVFGVEGLTSSLFSNQMMEYPGSASMANNHTTASPPGMVPPMTYGVGQPTVPTNMPHPVPSQHAGQAQQPTNDFGLNDVLGEDFWASGAAMAVGQQHQ